MEEKIADEYTIRAVSQGIELCGMIVVVRDGLFVSM